MTTSQSSSPVELLRANYQAILDNWIAEQKSSGAARPDLISDADLGRQCSEVLSMLMEALASGSTDISDPAWDRMRVTLRGISLSRARAGWTPAETVLFIFSLKQPIFLSLDEHPSSRTKEILKLDRLIDRLGLFTADVYQQGREEVIELVQTYLGKIVSRSHRRKPRSQQNRHFHQDDASGHDGIAASTAHSLSCPGRSAKARLRARCPGLPESVEYYVEAGPLRSRHFNIRVLDLPGCKMSASRTAIPRGPV